MIEVQVQLDGKPLRHTFVSHTPDFSDPIIELTDGDGVARFDGIKSSAKIAIVVHSQNLAVRMLDGTQAAVAEPSLRFKNKTDGSTLNITRKNKTFDHYAVMDRCYDAYETVFAGIAPFNSKSRGIHPYGGAGKPAHELKRKPRVDCRFPETLAPGRLPWVQPQSVLGGGPLMHIKPQSTDSRVFGSSKRKATTIPHEFAHAIHFAELPTLARWELAARYGLWIADELANRRSATHRTDKKTSPLIAFVESIGIFSQRFYFFATEVRADLTGAKLRAAFVDDELSNEPSLRSVLPGYTTIGTRQADETIKPRLTTSSVEGAVYGAIFLDFASRTSLATAVNLYLRCRGFDFDDFAKYARKQRSGAYVPALKAVAKTWQL